MTNQKTIFVQKQGLSLLAVTIIVMVMTSVGGALGFYFGVQSGYRGSVKDVDVLVRQALAKNGCVAGQLAAQPSGR